MEVSDFALTSSPVRNLIRFTPLGYPGGKGKLAPYVKRLIKDNGLLDGVYVEPYAGGAAIALELVFHEYVRHVYINDISRPIFSFWKSVLRHTDQFCRMIRDVDLTLDSWDHQKLIFSNASEASDLELGFATFFLNRTNRSGILNGGVIGGRAQDSAWNIDARFNKEELIFRVESIAKIGHRISLTRMDAIRFMQKYKDEWGDKALVYLDPPYYKKGRDLYYNFYEHDDHAAVANFVMQQMSSAKWIVSYDNEPSIRELYKGQRCGTYTIGYSARKASEGSEAMFFSESMHMSALVGAVRATEGFDGCEIRS